jgi:hypothetical protein
MRTPAAPVRGHAEAPPAAPLPRPGAAPKIRLEAEMAAQAATIAVQHAHMHGSPSKVGIGLGRNFGGAIALGILDSRGDVEHASMLLARSAIAGFLPDTGPLASPTSGFVRAEQETSTQLAAIRGDLHAIRQDVVLAVHDRRIP